MTWETCTVCKGRKQETERIEGLFPSSRVAVTVSRTGGLRTTEMYTSHILKSRVQVRGQAGHTPTEPLRGESFYAFPSPWCWLSVPGAPSVTWLSSPCVTSHYLPSMHSCQRIQVSPFYKDTSHIGLGPNLMTSF